MQLIAYGKILKPHGLKGEVKVLPYSGETENFKNFKSIYIYLENKKPQEYSISGRRFQKNLIIAKIEEIDSKEDADLLRGKEVYIDKVELPSTEDDEYYWFELIGLNVYRQDNSLVGKVDSIMDNTAQPILVIKNNSEEYMVPLVDNFVKKIDLENSKIVIEPIDGLI